MADAGAYPAGASCVSDVGEMPVLKFGVAAAIVTVGVFAAACGGGDVEFGREYEAHIVESLILIYKVLPAVIEGYCLTFQFVASADGPIRAWSVQPCARHSLQHRQAPRWLCQRSWSRCRDRQGQKSAAPDKPVPRFLMLP